MGRNLSHDSVIALTRRVAVSFRGCYLGGPFLIRQFCTSFSDLSHLTRRSCGPADSDGRTNC
jgi:hypothetical protein